MCKQLNMIVTQSKKLASIDYVIPIRTQKNLDNTYIHYKGETPCKSFSITSCIAHISLADMFLTPS